MVSEAASAKCFSISRKDFKMEKEYFVDGVGQIHFAGNMVRFDLVMQQLIDKLVDAGVLRKNENAK